MPHHHHHGPDHDPHRPSARDIREAIDADSMERLLERWVKDTGQRRFLARCIIDEGPAHHRGANYVILSILARLLEQLQIPVAPLGDRPLRVELRLPPHLREQSTGGEYPLDLPLEALAGIVAEGTAEERALVDCLIDGPAHHALANVATVRALHELALALGQRR